MMSIESDEARAVKSKYERRLSNIKGEKFPQVNLSVYRFYDETKDEKIFSGLINDFEKNEQGKKMAEGMIQGAYSHPKEPYQRALYGYHCLRVSQPYHELYPSMALLLVHDGANPSEKYQIHMERYCFIAYFEYLLDFLDGIINRNRSEIKTQDNSRVFISWSGEESKGIAQAFIEEMNKNIGGIETYFTPNDLKHGKRWGGELAEELKKAKCGVLILTRSNYLNSWINFEAGAISKHYEQSMVWPICFSFSKIDLQPPLALFQAADFNEPEMKKLLRELTELINGPDGEFEKKFETFWKGFEEKAVIISNRFSETDGENKVSLPKPKLKSKFLKKFFQKKFAKCKNFMIIRILHMIVC